MLQVTTFTFSYKGSGFPSLVSIRSDADADVTSLSLLGPTLPASYFNPARGGGGALWHIRTRPERGSLRVSTTFILSSPRNVYRLRPHNLYLSTHIVRGIMLPGRF